MFEIAFDSSTRVLRLRLSGFWTIGTMVRFTAALLTKAITLRFRGSDYSVLSDAREFPIQSKDVADGFTALMNRAAAYHRGKTAILVANPLSKMQAERTLQGDGVRVFLDSVEAEEWLELPQHAA